MRPIWIIFGFGIIALILIVDGVRILKKVKKKLPSSGFPDFSEDYREAWRGIIYCSLGAFIGLGMVVFGILYKCQ